jgi:molybdenum cofactor synthesis domain-containing protein
MSEKKIAFLATGDEIINGDTLNTNCHHIAHELFSHGMFPGLHISCSDEEPKIIECMQHLLKSHDALIITGGLGPTSDDRTRFALAKAINQELIHFESCQKHLEKRFSNLNLALTKSNQQQCYFPEKATPLPNPHGSAMGCHIEHESKLIFMLPGPPRECLPMFKNHALAKLKEKFGIQHHLLKWRIFGLPEGQISEILDKALANTACQTGYRWEYPYIEFKVLSEPAIHDTIKAIVNPLLESHIISPPDKTASQFLQDFLDKSSHKLCISDHATGGLLQATLSKPSLFEKVQFKSDKDKCLTLSIKGLDEYWHQKKSTKTSLYLAFSHDEHTLTETHQLPYKNAFIKHYAVEFICHRIYCFLNEKKGLTLT